MKHCVNCILNENTPYIDFNSDGLCSYCIEQEKMQINPKSNFFLDIKEFEKKLNKIRGKSKYDCIVAVSGGKDSISALYVVKKIFNLNPLVITFSNGFLTDEMVENIKEAIKILEVDWRLCHFSKIKKGFEYFLKSKYSKKIGICDICSLFISPIIISRRIANAENINLVFTGSTIEQKIGNLSLEEMPAYHQKYYKRYDNLKNETLNYLRQFKEIEDILITESEPNTAHITSPWYYIDQHSCKIPKILAELNWKRTQDSFPDFSSNCKLAYLTGYLGRKYNIPNYDITLSRSVRLKYMQREDAMNRFNKKISSSNIELLLSDFNINIQDI